MNTRSPLRILYVNTLDLSGGAARAVWNLFQGVRARGHDAWLAVRDKQSTDPRVLTVSHPTRGGVWARALDAASAPLEPRAERSVLARRLLSLLHVAARPRQEMQSLLGVEYMHYPHTYRLLDRLRQQPDLVHCHNLHGGYFDLRALSWLSRRVPVVLTLNDAWLLSGHCSHSMDCERWKTGCGRCPDLDIYPPIRRDATAYNWRRKKAVYDQSQLYLLALSQWLMDKVHASMLRGVQYRVIPNALDLEMFQPGSRAESRRALGLPLDAKIVLLTAYNVFKDYETMKAALAGLRANGAKLLFICLGREDADQDVGQGRMIYPGFERDSTRTVHYYRAADVYLHAAKGETLGQMTMEAMACGTPVVATAVGGIPETILDGQTGCLVPGGDSRAMAAALQRLLADEPLRAAMGQAGVADMNARFTLDRHVETYLAWYREIITDWKHNQ